MWPSRILPRSSSRAGQEHQVGQAQVRQRGDDAARMRQRQHGRPDDDAEHDLDDDLGHRNEAARRVGEDRGQDAPRGR